MLGETTRRDLSHGHWPVGFSRRTTAWRTALFKTLGLLRSVFYTNRDKQHDQLQQRQEHGRQHRRRHIVHSSCPTGRDFGQDWSAPSRAHPIDRSIGCKQGWGQNTKRRAAQSSAEQRRAAQSSAEQRRVAQRTAVDSKGGGLFYNSVCIARRRAAAWWSRPSRLTTLLTSTKAAPEE